MAMNVRTLCLAILYEGQASGYEIRKLSMDETCKFSHFIDVSYGAIYPALTKMEEEGLITGRVEYQDGKPPKRVYEITEAGRQEFVASLMHLPEPDKFKSEFLLVAMHANLLPREVVERAIDARMAYMREKVKAIETCNFGGLTDSTSFVFNYGLLMNRTSLRYLEENRELLLAQAGTGTKVEAAE